MTKNDTNPEPVPRKFVVLEHNPNDVTGGHMRPGRVMTVGRRRSDRWLVYSAIALLFAQGAFTLFVAWQLDQLSYLCGRP